MAEQWISDEEAFNGEDQYPIEEENETGIEKEDIGGEEKIVEPFDPALISISTRPMTMDLLLNRIRRGELDMAPDFQRRAGIWKEDASSRLIESMLIRIPLPAFYMDATNEDCWLVVDGLQRLTALKDFVINKSLKLRGLDFLKFLDGKSYDELSRSYQRRIEETQVTVYLIEKGTPANAKFNIFKRINTGGLPLSSQEIRHALYQGKGTKLLAELASSQVFLAAVDNGIKDKRMADRENILRFLAFLLTPYTSYSKDFETFLNNAIVALNGKSDAELEILRRRFYRSMAMAFDVFHKDAFRKRYKKQATRQPINKPLFECWSVSLDALTDQQAKLLVERKEPLQEHFWRLMNEDRAFVDAISYGTGDAKKVRLRFSAIQKVIEDVLQ